jgi:signal transduction histidine kinase
MRRVTVVIFITVLIVAIKRSIKTLPGLTRDNRRLKSLLQAKTLLIERALRKSEKHHVLLLAQSRQMQEHLRLLTHKILIAQEDERREISRELHDEIAQTLTGINVRLANLKREATVNTKGLKGKIAGTQRLVQESVKSVHRFARQLRPALLDDLGLIAAISSIINGLKERTHLPIALTTFSELKDLDVKNRTVLYRVAQEALTNVVRHADAKAVKVSFTNQRKTVLMEIKDDGRSFNVQHVLLAKNRKHLGVLGMRERVEMVGGKFKIESGPGKGTLISAEIPFRRSPGK